VKERTIQIRILEYSSINELDEIDQELIRKSRDASSGAYAPYSKFQVGAAVLLDNNEIITGNNQENAASPSGLCAERTALYYASAKYPGITIKSIAISAKRETFITKKPIVPCGSCLQVLAEYEEAGKHPIKIILDSISGIEVIEGIDNILPLRFKK
jgi:cytidine deaminase